jgi:hypothetical protein
VHCTSATATGTDLTRPDQEENSRGGQREGGDERGDELDCFKLRKAWKHQIFL